MSKPFTLEEIRDEESEANYTVFDCVMQFTWLKDKNWLDYIYESDIINQEGLIIWNIYENKEIYNEWNDWIVANICTKNRRHTEEELIKRWCKYA